MSEMTFERFHNALRILLNIEWHEFAGAIGPLYHDGRPPHEQWERFRNDPHRWFISAPTAHARAIWELVKARQP